LRVALDGATISFDANPLTTGGIGSRSARTQ
jgi:hypothetical protein